MCTRKPLQTPRAPEPGRWRLAGSGRPEWHGDRGVWLAQSCPGPPVHCVHSHRPVHSCVWRPPGCWSVPRVGDAAVGGAPLLRVMQRRTEAGEGRAVASNAPSPSLPLPSVAGSASFCVQVHHRLSEGLPAVRPGVRSLTHAISLKSPTTCVAGAVGVPIVCRGTLGCGQRCHDPHSWIPHLHLKFYLCFQSVPSHPSPTCDPRFERNQR